MTVNQVSLLTKIHLMCLKDEKLYQRFQANRWDKKYFPLSNKCNPSLYSMSLGMLSLSVYSEPSLMHNSFIILLMSTNKFSFIFEVCNNPETKTCFTPYDLHFAIISLKLLVNCAVWSWLWLFKISLTLTWIIVRASYVASCNVAST